MSREVRRVYRWDLDKTYLRTEFDSLSRLARIPFETADQKVNVPASAALLRELSSPLPGEPAPFVSILSGSPLQMRRVLEEKLALDGIRWDEFVLKDNLGNLVRGRFRALREQVGYKLPALLRSRAALPPGSREVLFGDDSEADAVVYSIYADLVAGRLTVQDLQRVLRSARAYADARSAAREALSAVPRADAVEVVFIHLDQRTPPHRFAALSPRVVPVFNWFQATLVLFARGHLDAAAVVRITRAWLEQAGVSPEVLANHFQDIVRRGHLPAHAAERLGLLVSEAEATDAARRVVWGCVRRFRDVSPGPRYRAPSAPDPLPDYALLVDRGLGAEASPTPPAEGDPAP